MKCLLAVTLLGLFGNRCLAGEPNADRAPQLHEVRIEHVSRTVSVSLVVFPEKDYSLRVIDNASADDVARYLNLASAMESNGCVAGCNGVFFNRKPFAPVGGMISDSKRINIVDPITWMKGLLVVRNGRPTLESSESYQDTPAVTDLLQSGIWLVRAGKPASDSDQTKTARRTFICHDGKGTWAIGLSERCTFHELATALKSPEVTAILNIQEALNLDGGPSTGLWLKQSPDNFYLPEKWAVRNFIGIAPRSTQ